MPNKRFKPLEDDVTRVYYDEETSLSRHVVCAAVKLGDNILVGPRHWDATMRRQYELNPAAYDKKKTGTRFYRSIW